MLLLILLLLLVLLFSSYQGYRPAPYWNYGYGPSGLVGVLLIILVLYLLLGGSLHR